MRDILFRAKRNDGVWLYGGGIIADSKKTYIVDGAGVYEICPDTVGEYIGLTDKNGTKIFEGDIVSYHGTVHKVVFENRYYNAYFGIMMSDVETWGFCMSTPPNMMEVIGNIHDNPELLTA